jgi:hypothetical protein
MQKNDQNIEFREKCHFCRILVKITENSDRSIKPRVARFLLTKYTKTGENIPYYQNITKWAWHIPNGRKIFEMAIKYSNNFQSKVHQNLPKLGLLVWKCTIWQPWSRPVFFIWIISNDTPANELMKYERKVVHHPSPVLKHGYQSPVFKTSTLTNEIIASRLWLTKS